MEEQEKVVKEEAVATPAQTEQTPVKSVEIQETQQSVASEPQVVAENVKSEVPEIESVDERGVPYKNVAFEYKRKLEDLAEKLPELAKAAAKEVLSQKEQPKQEEYSIAQLEKFAQDNPEYRAWAEEEKSKVVRKQIIQELKAAEEEKSKVQLAEQKKQHALQYVAQQYPEVLKKDQAGKIVGWDANNVMTKTIAEIMRDPRLKDMPEALSIAADLAYARIAKGQLNKVQKDLTKKQAETTNLKKQTMIEGQGKAAVTENPSDSIKKKFIRSGKTSDAAEYMKSILFSQE